MPITKRQLANKQPGDVSTNHEQRTKNSLNAQRRMRRQRLFNSKLDVQCWILDVPHAVKPVTSNKKQETRNKSAFTLVELMIVVAILGILAAIAMPTFQGHIQKARESAAKDSLRILRNAIELYAAQHNDVPPGYANQNLLPSATVYIQFIYYSNSSGWVSSTPSPQAPLGPYLKKMPKNPFNNLDTVLMVQDGDEIPEATGTYGWVYKPATKDIRLDWPGTDSEGYEYFDY